MITGPTRTEEILTPISSIFGAFTILNCCGQVESSGDAAAGRGRNFVGHGLTVCCLTMCRYTDCKLLTVAGQDCEGTAICQRRVATNSGEPMVVASDRNSPFFVTGCEAVAFCFCGW